MMLFSGDYLLHSAWSLSITSVNNTNAVVSITRLGSQIFVGSNSANLIEVWQSGAKVGTVASTDPVTLHTFNERIYSFDQTGLIINEYEPVSGGNPILLRTSASLTSCGASSDPRFVEGAFYCSTGAGNTIKTLNLTTFTITTSGTVNTGGSACNVPIINLYVPSIDVMFLDCSTTGNIAVVEGWTASATPDFSVAHVSNINDMAFDPINSKLMTCPASGVDCWIYDWTAGGAPALSTTLTFTSTADCEEDCIIYDEGGRFIFTTLDELVIVDPDTEAVTTTISGLPCTGTSQTCELFSYSSTLLYYAIGTANYQIIDLTGVPEGGEGGVGGVTPASICYIDTNFDGNANIIYYDVGGPNGAPSLQNPDGGVPDGMCDASLSQVTRNDKPVGDSTGDILCQLGVIPCDPITGEIDNPDIQTNGVGYLLFFLLLAIMLAIVVWASHGRQLASTVNTAIYMVVLLGSAGIAVGFGWLAQMWFFIIIVVVIAFATPTIVKFINTQRGGGKGDEG